MRCFVMRGHRTAEGRAKGVPRERGTAILSPSEDVEGLFGAPVVYPVEVGELFFVGGELVVGVGVHVGVAEGDDAVGGAVDEVDAHVGAPAAVDSDEALATGGEVFGEVVNHFGVAEDVGIVGFAFDEVDDGVAAFDLVEFVGVDLLDAEDVGVEPGLAGAGGVVGDDDGVGKGLVVLVPDDGAAEELDGGVGGGVEEGVGHGLGVGAEEFDAVVGGDGTEVAEGVVEDEDGVGVEVEGVGGGGGVLVVVIDKADEGAVGDEGGVVHLAGFGVAGSGDDVVDGVAEGDVAYGDAVFGLFPVVEGVAGDVFFAVVDLGVAHGVGVAEVGVVGAVLGVHGGGVGVDVGGAPEMGHGGDGVVGEGVGEEAHVGVGEFDGVVDVDNFGVGVVVAFAADEAFVLVGGNAPGVVGGGGGEAVVGEVVGAEEGAAVDEADGVVPDVEHTAHAIVVELVAEDGGGVGEFDFDVAEGGEVVEDGVEEGGVGVEDHAFVLGTDALVENPDVGVGGVAGTHAGFVGDEFLGPRRHRRHQEQEQEDWFQDFYFHITQQLQKCKDTKHFSLSQFFLSPCRGKVVSLQHRLH